MCADRNHIDEMLYDAVRAAHERERVLFAERAHERSIVFHIARHLAARVDVILPGWSVDVDYDRWHPAAIQAVKNSCDGAEPFKAALPEFTAPNQDGLPRPNGARLRATPPTPISGLIPAETMRIMMCTQTSSSIADQVSRPNTTCS